MTTTPPRPNLSTNGVHNSIVSPATTPTTNHNLSYDNTIEQDKLLDYSIDTIHKQCYYMNKSIDSNNLRDTLKYASSMCSELRTTKLSSTRYYELYNTIYNELNSFVMYIDGNKDQNIIQLYEIVQQISNIIPRLYLLICVGKIYIQQQPTYKLSILYDLLELCKGVQQPLNGLFLRYYMLQNMKQIIVNTDMTKLSIDHTSTSDDTSTTNSAEHTNDSIQLIDWLMTNLTEMTKLYYRSRTEQGNVLQLIGQNFVILTELNYSIQSYRTIIFPRLQHVLYTIDNKYSVLQSYILESLLSVTTTDYLYSVIENIFSMFTQWNHLQSLYKLFDTLLKRFSTDYNNQVQIDSVKLYDMFSQFIDKISHSDKTSKLAILQMYRNLFEYCIKSQLWPQLNTLSDTLVQYKHIENAQPIFVDVCELSVSLLSLDQLLQLNNFQLIYSDVLDSAQQHSIVFHLLNVLVKNHVGVSDHTQIKQIFKLCKSLSNLNEPELNTLCQFIQLTLSAQSSQPIQQFIQVVSIIDKCCHPLLLSHYQFIETITYQILYQFNSTHDVTQLQLLVPILYKLINILSSQYSELCIKLLLTVCHVLNRYDEFSGDVYDYCAQILIIYEDEVSDSKLQYIMIHTLINNIRQYNSIPLDQYNVLAQKIIQLSHSLLRKQDCIGCLLQCTHLYYSAVDSGRTDEKKLLQLLQRTLKLTNDINTDTIKNQLFVDILCKYIYFYKYKIAAIQIKYINGIIELIQQQLADSISVDQPSIQQYYVNILRYIQYQQSDKNQDDRERWNEIVVQKSHSNRDQLFDVE